jgi:CheY-like chemotaxis protein
MPPPAISIVVAEDNAIFARGLTDLLGAMPEVAVLEVATDRDTAVVAVQRHSPDVVITDLRMPPTSTDEGLQVAQRARAHSRRTGVIVFSQFAEADTGKLPVVCSAPLPSPPDGSVGSSGGSRSSRTIPRSTPLLARPRLTRLLLAGTRGFTRRFSGASIASSFPAAW